MDEEYNVFFTYIYEFGKARFVKHNDNSCLHTRDNNGDKISKILFQGEIDICNYVMSFTLSNHNTGS